MKKLLFLTCLFVGSFVNIAIAENPSFIKTKDGLIVFTDSTITGISNAVKLEVLTDNIIRVTTVPGKEFASTKSLVNVFVKQEDIFWNVVDAKDSIILTTKKIRAVVNIKTGSVVFWNSNGVKILSEKPIQGRIIQPTVLEGKPYYEVTQYFQTASDDAWYGLGQHQQGAMNYKGQQVSLFQNNTEVAVPFLVSNKNYGILWDNYSLTKVGDVRPFLLLSSFQLFSKNGDQGWLTATYSNDKLKPENIATIKAESNINMEFLGESTMMLPKNFKPETGIAVWEGSIASGLNGLHQLKFILGGTLKVWLNNKLVLNYWRKAW
ncbi:MAG: alpha-xylosidase, partial [Ferruginibacter sp.]